VNSKRNGLLEGFYTCRSAIVAALMTVNKFTQEGSFARFGALLVPSGQTGTSFWIAGGLSHLESSEWFSFLSAGDQNETFANVCAKLASHAF
jgi:hypothetical protein